MPHDWIVPAWPAPPHVKGLITTRNGGVSTGAHESFNLGLRAGDDDTLRINIRAILAADPSLTNQACPVGCEDSIIKE